MPKEAKFKQYFREMFEANRDLCTQFLLINQDYANDKMTHKDEFDRVGSQVKDLIQNTLHALCAQVESGSKGKFSEKLEEKFLEEVVKYFPYYHDIGVALRRR